MKFLSNEKLKFLLEAIRETQSEGGSGQTYMAGEGIEIRNGVISSPKEVFYAEYGVTSYADLKAAYDAKKDIKLRASNADMALELNLSLVEEYDDEAYFLFSTLMNYGSDCTAFGCLAIFVKSTGESAWEDIDTNQLQRTQDKTSTISGEGDTAQYPSTKAVVDYVGSKVPLVTTNVIKDIFKPYINSTTLAWGHETYMGTDTWTQEFQLPALDLTDTVNSKELTVYLENKNNSTTFRAPTGAYISDGTNIASKITITSGQALEISFKLVALANNDHGPIIGCVYKEWSVT